MSEKPHENWPRSGPSDPEYKQQMNSFHEGLWQHLEVVPTLEPQTRDAVMRYLLELACQAQHIHNIMLGRSALLGFPREWVVQNIERSAAFLLELENEWEYRRLLEVYKQLDDDLVHRLIVYGLASPKSDIREAAQDWAE